MRVPQMRMILADLAVKWGAWGVRHIAQITPEQHDMPKPCEGLGRRKSNLFGFPAARLRPVPE